MKELSQRTSGMLDARAAAAAGKFDLDPAIANTLRRDAERYRVSVTIGDTQSDASMRMRGAIGRHA